MATFNEIRRVLGSACESVVDDLNVYGFVPRRPSLPCVVIRTQKPAADYLTTWSAGYAEWMFEVLLITGRVVDEASQEFLGDMISGNAPLIQALNGIEFSEGPGYGHAHVRKCEITDMRVGATRCACARLTVLVRA
jgi:hypothetical protein